MASRRGRATRSAPSPPPPARPAPSSQNQRAANSLSGDRNAGGGALPRGADLAPGKGTMTPSRYSSAKHPES